MPATWPVQHGLVRAKLTTTSLWLFIDLGIAQAGRDRAAVGSHPAPTGVRASELAVGRATYCVGHATCSEADGEIPYHRPDIEPC